MLINLGMAQMAQMEFSIKVSPEGLNNNRVIVAYDADDAFAGRYIKDKYPSDVHKFYLKNYENYDRVFLGVDGMKGVRKLYLEADAHGMIAMESKGDKRSYKKYTEEKLPIHTYHCYETDSQFKKNDKKHICFGVFRPMKAYAGVLLGLCKQYADDLYTDFEEWISLEKRKLTWIGVSENSFTVYYTT